MLCCAVLFCTVLCCAALCCTALCCAVLHCTVLHCAVLCYFALYCAVLCFIVLCCALSWRAVSFEKVQPLQCVCTISTNSLSALRLLLPPPFSGRPIDREREDVIEKIRQDRYSMLLKPTHEYDTFQELQVMLCHGVLCNAI